MRRFDYQAGEKDQGTIALVLDLAKTSERVSLPVVWAWASFPKRFCVCSAVTSSIRGEFNLKDVQRIRSRPSRPFSVGRIWSCLLLRFVLQDTLSEVMNVFPPLEFECVCGWECSKKEGMELSTSLETLGAGLRTRTKQQGAKEKERRKLCDVRCSVIRKSLVFQKNNMKTGARKLLRMGLVLARVWREQAVATSLAERLKLRRQMAAAAGKTESVSSSLFMELNNLEIGEELSTMPTLSWTEGVWMGK